MSDKAAQDAESVALEQVGWILDDGDEYHGFRYYSRADSFADKALKEKGWLPVFVLIDGGGADD